MPAVMQVIEEHVANLNHVNVATALHRLGSCGLQPGGREAERLLADPRVGQLLRLAEQHLSSFAAREVANCLWALAKLGYQQQQPAAGAAASDPEAHHHHHHHHHHHQQAEDVAAAAAAAAAASSSSGGGCGGVSGGSLLAGLCTRAEATLGGFGPQEVANALWALGALGHHPGEPLLRGLTERLRGVLPELAPQGLSNCLLGLAKLGWSPGADCLDEVTRGSLPKMDDFEPQALSNTPWSLARLGHRNEQLQEAVFQQALRRIADFVPQGVSNLVWAAATLGLGPGEGVGGGGGEGGNGSEGSNAHHQQTQQQQEEAGLMPKLLLCKCCDLAVTTLQSYTPQNLSNLLWATAKMDYRHQPLLAAAASRAAKDLQGAARSRKPAAAAAGGDGGGSGGGGTGPGGDLHSWTWSSQAVSNIIWAYATLGVQPGAEFLGQVCRHVSCCAPSYRWQELANTAWALATLGHRDTSALAAVEEEVVARMRKAAASSSSSGNNDGVGLQQQQQQQQPGGAVAVQPADVSMLLWAYAALQHPAPGLFASLLPSLTQRQNLAHTTDAELINILWATATLKAHDDQSLDTIAEHIRTHRLSHLQPRQVAEIAWAYGELRHAHKALFDGLVSRAAAASLLSSPAAAAAAAAAGSIMAISRSSEATRLQRLARLCCAAGIFGWRYPALLDAVTESFTTFSRSSSSSGRSSGSSHGSHPRRALADSGGSSTAAGVYTAPCTAAVETDSSSSSSGSSRRAAQRRLAVVAVGLAWSLSLVGGCSPEMWGHLMGLLLLGPTAGMGEEEQEGGGGGRVPDEVLPDEVLRRLYQTYLHVQLAYPTAAAALAPGPPGLLHRAAEVWRQSTKWGAQVSYFQREVSEALNGLGLSHTVERLLDDGDFSIDLAVEVEVKVELEVEQHFLRIAVEADGPWHFTSNSRQPLGTTLCRRRCLEARGWVVVSVPYWRWYQRPDMSPAERDELLLELFREAGLGEVLAVAARRKPAAAAAAAARQQQRT
ncbi:hypothetical protein PLESTM_001410800 [Pleodorina starrii]|nr:hypothetical protein PLESTM_001410800 [Pleodorina starrii]